MLAVQDSDLSGLLLYIGFGAVLVVLAIFVRSCRQRRMSEMLEKWAREQGIRLLDFHREWKLFGPFFFHAKGQKVVRILVEFPDGRTASGWALCGSQFFGMFANKVAVRWDKEKPEPPGFPVIMPGQKDQYRGDN